MMGEKDETKKFAAIGELKDKALPAFLDELTKVLEKNGGKYLVGDSLSVADIAASHIVNYLVGVFGEDWKETYTVADAYFNSVLELPKIKKWIETRPKTEK